MNEKKLIYRSKKDLRFKSVSKGGKYLHPRAKVKKNIDEFESFITDICREALPDLPKGKKYYAPAISCNRTTLEYFLRYIDPMIYLDIAPREDNTLENFEFSVDMNKIIGD